MAKSKEGRQDEFYLAQIRELRATVKSLKRRIRQLEKREHQFEDDDTDDLPELPTGEQNKLLHCPECGKGKMEAFELLGRVFSTCNICGHRIKLK